jgi:NADH dehydrogenase [ubiquinone] 1 alpha subcomplex assembly factor 5
MATPDTGHDPIRVFDARALRLHRRRAAQHGRNRADFLFVESAERLADRLADINRAFPKALDLGCRDGLLARQLRSRGGIASLVGCDAEARFAGAAPGPHLVAEGDALPFAPRSFDLVLSNLALHWTNDLPGALLQLRHTLKPDGLLLAAMLAGETLHELRAALIEAESEIENGASPRVSPFADPRDLAALLQRAGFALPVVDSDRITATYTDALALMRDLRDMGESNALIARRRGFTRRATLLRAAALYQERYANADGRIRASFEIATLTAWAPHQEQPKALRPGSAQARLADALDAEERSAGERARPAKPRDSEKKT